VTWWGVLERDGGSGGTTFVYVGTILGGLGATPGSAAGLGSTTGDGTLEGDYSLACGGGDGPSCETILLFLGGFGIGRGVFW
jgi:hypothetical protein